MHFVSNKRLAYCGELMLNGHSGRSIAFSAACQIDLAVFDMSISRICLEDLESRSRSYGNKWDVTWKMYGVRIGRL